jgi:hypothetical protein
MRSSTTRGRRMRSAMTVDVVARDFMHAILRHLLFGNLPPGGPVSLACFGFLTGWFGFDG